MQYGKLCPKRKPADIPRPKVNGGKSPGRAQRPPPPESGRKAKENKMTIAEVAQKYGLTADTLRYYERVD